jgi:CBS domain-containing protein
MHTRDVMTANPAVVGPDTSLAEAGRMMLDQHLSALAVTDQMGHLLGIVTDGDLLRRPELDTAMTIGFWRGFFAPETSASAFTKTRGRKMGEVMTRTVVSTTIDTTLDDVVGLMETKRIKQMPVLSGSRLVGMITRRCLLDALVSRLEAVGDVVVDDEAAAQMVSSAIAQSNWASKNGVRVSVSDGIASLSGTVSSDAERLALIVIAENTRGVTSVYDQMVFVDPNSGIGFGSF